VNCKRIRKNLADFIRKYPYWSEIEK
jgi:hypothetical protein